MSVNIKQYENYLIYSEDIPYQISDKIIFLSPIKMNNILYFEMCKESIIVQKNSIFRDKKIIKMKYLEFIKYCYCNKELEKQYEINNLSNYLGLILHLLSMVFNEKSHVIKINENLDIFINDCLITDEIFDDLRKIIIFQNDIDFDIKEFINIDTKTALENAEKFENSKRKETSTIEDYIDSVIVSFQTTEEFVMNLSIRKFWRYVKRINAHEQYMAFLQAELSGMVTFKEQFRHWMSSPENVDKYSNVKTDESELRKKAR